MVDVVERQGAVQRRAVVPHHQVSRRPAMAVDELRLGREGQEFAQQKPIALVLPCHGRDLMQPALAHIIAELREAPWLGEVVVSLNGLTCDFVGHAEHLFDSFDCPTKVLWNDLEPKVGSVLKWGKGANFRAAIAFLSGGSSARIIASQDCDVISFRRTDLARLCYAVAHPKIKAVLFLSDTPAIRRNVYLLPKFSMRAMISLLYPQSVLELRTPDEMFREETESMAVARHSIHLM